MIIDDSNSICLNKKEVWVWRYIVKIQHLFQENFQINFILGPASNHTFSFVKTPIPVSPAHPLPTKIKFGAYSSLNAIIYNDNALTIYIMKI